MLRKIVVLLLSLLSLTAIFAEGVVEETSTPRFVASTSWVAAIAEIAGLDGVDTVAPADLKHPPEYEITPMDVAKVAKAEIFMYGGYEAMMKTIAEAAEVKEECKVQVRTTNTLSNLTLQVEKISKKAGTEAEAKKRLGEFEALFQDARAKIKGNGLDQIKVWANSNQAEFCNDLGLNVVDTFGPGPLSSDELLEAKEAGYDLIIDNYHAVVTSPLSEIVPSTPILIFTNFPSSLEKNALYKVISGNLEMLWNAFGI